MLTLLAQLDFYKAATEAELPTAVGSAEEAGGGFALIISAMLSGVMLFAALLLLFYLIWGGLEWIYAGGESSKIQKARDKMTQAVIGLIVLAASIAIFTLVQSFLGLDAIQFDSSRQNAIQGINNAGALQRSTPLQRARNSVINSFGSR